MLLLAPSFSHMSPASMSIGPKNSQSTLRYKSCWISVERNRKPMPLATTVTTYIANQANKLTEGNEQQRQNEATKAVKDKIKVCMDKHIADNLQRLQEATRTVATQL